MKTRFDLLDMGFIKNMSDMLTDYFEVGKYKDTHWILNACKWSDEYYFSKIMRHLVDYRQGICIDGESGKSQLIHIAILAMMWNYKKVIACIK